MKSLPIRRLRRRLRRTGSPPIILVGSSTLPWAAQVARPPRPETRRRVSVTELVRRLGGIDELRRGLQGPATERRIRASRPCREWIVESERGPGYAAARIRFFMSARRIPAIEVGVHADDSLDLLRGYHRLIAAFLSQRKRIAVRFVRYGA